MTEVRKPLHPLECPVCGAALYPGPGLIRCPHGHSFDIAREGYVNLLGSQHARRAIEGDTAEMLAARRRFLAAGHFAPLAEIIAVRAAAALKARALSGEPAVVLDAGCGEGYYVGTLAEHLRDQPDVELFGADVSKDAVRLAAKRYPSVTFFVADTHQRIYLRDACAALVTNVFAPRNAGEFARILEPGGRVLIALPSERHLAEVREELHLLDVQGDKERRVLESFAADFALVARRELEYELVLSADEVRDLVAMGPNSWHHRPSVEEMGDGMRTLASFVLVELRLLDGAA